MVDIYKKPLWHELKLDLKANAWDNGRLITALRIILLGQGFQLLLLYRLQVRLERVPVVGRTLRLILRWITSVITSCNISGLAHLEGGVLLPHPHGIVIGRDCVVKSGATIYQHVTLGSRAGAAEKMEFPVIEKDVTIFAGAVIVGGIHIGEGAVIGANAVVLKDVPAGATAVGVPARIV